MKNETQSTQENDRVLTEGLNARMRKAQKERYPNAEDVVSEVCK